MAFWRPAFRLSTLITCNQSTHVIRNDLRGIKRWVAPTLKELARRRAKVGPDPPQPRSTHLEWNYDIEVKCFGKRLGEHFDQKLLKEAFVQREYANLEEFKAKDRGDEEFVISHNQKLAEDGLNLLHQTINDNYSKQYPTDIVTALISYLTSNQMLAHIATHIGMKELVKAKEYPPEDLTLADAFKAVVGALSQSSDSTKVQQFIKDFVICQMISKDIFDVWSPENPYEYAQKLLESRGVKSIEPRLCNQSATNTILANYQVGLYNQENKACLGLGWGENIQIAKDTAALDAIHRIYCISN